MDKPEKDNIPTIQDNSAGSADMTTPPNKPKNRGKKRKRRDSESSTDLEDILPENTLEVEKNLQASAIKNNLDDASVKKILKKVVTNDHVLALVKLREEEENSSSVQASLQPKLTRAKVKELMKVSPKSAPWNLELTPIKHIPVKTRPEVEALISKDLPEDEDDDEYQPTHDDVPSDDDQTLESCSDLESQPRTPATPGSIHASPRVLKDGPFKVPMSITTPTRRKLIIEEEEATIALRTRSKLSLSSTSIEHIESSFVPPDEVPTPVVDDLWNQFLEQCLNPAEVSKHEDDDEADPEYNVAADPDAHDEDEEALENSIIKISKKELNDLVTELFSIMPEVTADDQLAENLANNVLTDNNATEISSHWEGKQEPMSEDEKENQENKFRAQKINQQKRDSAVRFSIGKSEPEDSEYNDAGESSGIEVKKGQQANVRIIHKVLPHTVNISVEEKAVPLQPDNVPPPTGPSPPQTAPPSLRSLQQGNTTRLQVQIDSSVTVLPEQIQILQQQLRQHIQLATSNFLQLYVNPVHWNLAPTYKEYLEQFSNMVQKDPNSVVNVCNLKPAVELVEGWQKTVSQDTPENKKMVEFIQDESERSRRRFHQNSLYIGEFPELFLQTVANSGVFLYPYLLPAMPYRADSHRKFSYKHTEDELIALGLDQFWQYIDDNPQLFKRSQHSKRSNWGLAQSCALICKHMFPWLTPRWLQSHIHRAKKDKENPLYKFFQKREITPVKHKILPYNPALTLYEQPEHEMPRIWIRYLAKSSKRFRTYLYKRRFAGLPPDGVPIKNNIKEPIKKPLPIDFTKPIICNRIFNDPKDIPPLKDKFDVQIVPGNNENIEVGVTVAITPGNLVAANETWSIGNVVGNMMTAVKLVVNNTSEADKTISTADNTSISNITATTGSITGPLMSINAGVITLEPTNIGNNTNNQTDVNTTNIGDAIKVTESVDAKTESNDTCVENLTTTRNVAKAIASLIPVGKIPNVVSKEIATDGEIVRKITGNNTNPAQNSYVLPPNMYRVVPTSLGAYLVPLTPLPSTATVNSINKPISSTVPNTNDVSGPSKNSILTEILKQAERLKTHCQCCILMKKICKEKQSLITDFFKTKKVDVKCECTYRKYPRITNRLRMLVNNYKNRSRCEQNKLEAMMGARNGTSDLLCETEKESSEENRLDDLACVTSYQMKLTIKSALVRNIYTKKKIHTLFSTFDADSHDPLTLAKEMYRALEIELLDLYKEFVGFLTAEQADKINRFKDYFVNRCMGDLLKRVEIRRKTRL
ncbi:uncharacterized protein LOC126374289 isoform X2 [Pectinophora gossypiella]|uniref:uncharacterized protein LOC126374289 isoform X2 n=1 Tax=Pectinophora gossypiella TaxID=13191 RepID=UPI00214E6C78|nr:uncharacterized protein LOC126374289 isoform X2 [Pectinophora gossypiella]